MKTTPYPLAMPPDLLGEVRAAAAATGLSLAATMRQSMKLGLPRLRAQLSPSGALKPFTKAEAKRAFRPHPEWDDLEARCARRPRPEPKAEE